MKVLRYLIYVMVLKSVKKCQVCKKENCSTNYVCTYWRRPSEPEFALSLISIDVGTYICMHVLNSFGPFKSL
jgi:hypothetical protein